MKTIGYTQWKPGVTFYVAQLKGDGHPLRNKCDWGYHTDPAKAIHLSPYWMKRFKAANTFCGRTTHFLEVPS